MKSIQVKIITLYCGENEFDKCVNMASCQRCTFFFEQVFIKNKANAEAHNELYKIVMAQADDFDYFVKLDADMVFKSENSLQKLITMAVESGGDIFSIPVHDYMTDSMIWGLNIYRSGVKWLLGTDDLFTDQQRLDGAYVAAKKNLLESESLVSHAENPSDFQAFVFGVHRAAKVVQVEADKFLLGHAWGQLDTLFKVVDAYKKSGDKKRALAIIGAYFTLNKLNKNVGLNRKEDFVGEFDAVSFESDLDKSLRYFGHKKIIVLFKSVGIFRLFSGFFEYAKRRLK
ncbi:hypothetical protein [Stutzerimonas stutzeri]|uniref:hypothetical protein n=1 Tax=Stutzerimonas stutzeri TaxID=316 RepID=UPI0015E2A095|nr:hypothetical protein [Stutzerimonas stutzeri]MBA1277432.1 hypothetical protein [Stutzerimonas stutzeri]